MTTGMIIVVVVVVVTAVLIGGMEVVVSTTMRAGQFSSMGLPPGQNTELLLRTCQRGLVGKT